MKPIELEKIATQAGWIFREDRNLVVTAEPPKSLIYDVHPDIDSHRPSPKVRK